LSRSLHPASPSSTFHPPSLPLPHTLTLIDTPSMQARRIPYFPTFPRPRLQVAASQQDCSVRMQQAVGSGSLKHDTAASVCSVRWSAGAWAASCYFIFSLGSLRLPAAWVRGLV
jgi:hypothetical protein